MAPSLIGHYCLIRKGKQKGSVVKVINTTPNGAFVGLAHDAYWLGDSYLKVLSPLEQLAAVTDV